MPVRIISLGGSFEKSYAEGAGIENYSFPLESHSTRIVRRFCFNPPSVVYSPMNARDSIHTTDEDRERVAHTIQSALEKRFVIIHGTDTMTKTAEVICSRCPGKVVVMTGAALPATDRESDAEFNLGGAIIAAKICTPGVYIVMNGEIYPFDKCRKNPKSGKFEPA